jgi:glycosyltransferase involved in cell wall biosynthesis
VTDATDKPILFVTNHVPPDRAGAFQALHAREHIELALFGGRSRHATADVDDPGVPHRRIAEGDARGLAASGAYRTVICGTAGRRALPGAVRGARRAKVPFLLWSALWAHPTTPAHLAARPLMRRIYRNADAVVAYGPHVAAFAHRHGAQSVFVAPQAVDNAWWSEPQALPNDKPAPFVAMFVGRDDREKGVRVILDAWRASGLGSPQAALVLVGVGPELHQAHADGAAIPLGPQAPEQVRNFYAQADVVVIPSIRTRAFREPWALVANEAMNQYVPIIASDEVGAVAGGLVRHERNGLVVPAGDAKALAAALRRLHDDPKLRTQLGDNGARDVAPYTFDAWAQGFSRALTATATARTPC